MSGADVDVRRAVLDDAEQLASLHVRVWDEAYTGLMTTAVLEGRNSEPLTDRIERWRHWLTVGTTWVAERDGQLIGFAGAGPGQPEDLAELPGISLQVHALYVVAAVYGTGVGHRLLAAAIGDESAFLWVLDGNVRAITFYERHGFRLDGAVLDGPYGRERRMVRAAVTS